MPQKPRNGGAYLIQNKATGKQLGLPNSSMLGVFKDQHIVSRDQGAVWEIEFVSVTDSQYCFRLKTLGPFPWSNVEDSDSDFGSLGSNRDHHVFAGRPSDGEFEIWRPELRAESFFVLVNRATGLALDGTNGNIYAERPNFGDFQQWGFYAAPPDAF
jgi:hypothetical protein